LKVRRPSVAGQFYEGTRVALASQIEGCFRHRLGPGKIPVVNREGKRCISALISPHAGYMFSGPVAANGFYALASDGPVEEFIIVGPNHTGVGSGVSIMREGTWRTPLGEVSIDSGLADKIRSESTLIDVDEPAHAMEHSIEVQLPFLQSLFGSDFRFVPICMMMQDLQTSREVGSAIGHAATGMNLIIIASSDMTHYESHERAVTKDQAAIDAILKLDEELLQAVVESKGISMCGYGPVSVAIVAAKLLGATRAKLLAYATSGDITGEKYAVVGYASISIEKP